MIGPPGLPKFGRRVFPFARPKTPHRIPSHAVRNAFIWASGLYFAGVLAHFGHHMVNVPPRDGGPAFEALISAPLSLAWPADLIGTLISIS